jgi:hypothetical protein
MNKIIQGALVANAASLGFHWIYDGAYIKKVAATEPIVFKTQEKHHYQAAQLAYLSYEGLPIGSFSMQGYILRGLTQRLQENPDFNQADYQAFIYQHLKPGGVYQGYVESYVNKMIAVKLSEQLDLHMPPLNQNDDHLIGLMPYLAVRALKLPLEKAWTLASLFTQDQDYQAFYQMLESYFDLVPTLGLQGAMKEAIEKSPSNVKPLFEEALLSKDTDAFVTKHDLVSCSVHKALPVAFHVAYHAESYEEAIISNMKIGGNLSDRGAIIGAMLSAVHAISEAWILKANLK